MSGRGEAGQQSPEEHMKVTEKTLVERYASMTDEELLALDERKLTPEAASLRRAELSRKGVTETSEQHEARARREDGRQADLRKNRTRQLVAVALVAGALLTEFAAARFIDVPAAASTAVVVVLCVAALWVLRGRR